MPGGSGAQPVYAIYDETEPYFREHPSEAFTFMPVGLNAHKQGRLVCFRHAADLPQEAEEQGVKSGQPGTASWTEVLWKDRQCPLWSRYESGLAPREHLAEARAQKFESKLSSVATRLTWLAIGVTLVIGFVQLLVMTPDAIGCQTVKNVLGWFGALSWLTCK